MVDLELVAKGKLGNLLLHLGKLVIVFLVLGDPLQDVLDELALCVTDGDGELEVAEDDLALLQEEYLALETVPFVKVLLADLVQVVLGDGGDLFGNCGNLLGDGGDLLSDGGDLLGDGGDLLGDGVDLLGDGGDPRSIVGGVIKDDCCTEMFRGNGNSKVSPNYQLTD